jgi:hypothetical protein
MDRYDEYRRNAAKAQQSAARARTDNERANGQTLTPFTPRSRAYHGPCVSNTGVRACTASRVRRRFSISPTSALGLIVTALSPVRADVPLIRCRTRRGLANGLQSHAKVLGSELETCLNLR